MIKDLQEMTSSLGVYHQHIADLVEGAFFFAMRCCKFSKTKRTGKRKPISLGDVTFRDKIGREIDKQDEDLS